MKSDSGEGGKAFVTRAQDGLIKQNHTTATAAKRAQQNSIYRGRGLLPCYESISGDRVGKG